MATPLKRKAIDAATSATKKPKANATITSFFSSPSSSAGATAKQSNDTAPSSSPPTTQNGETSPNSSQPTSSTSATATKPVQNVNGWLGGSASTTTSNFDKAKWVEKLTPEQKDLLALEIDTLDESWLAQLKDEVLSKDFLELKRFLKREHETGKKIFPPAPDVYSWYVHILLGLFILIERTDHLTRSRHTPLSTVKVVILGQDPYHNHNQAHGLCFSVRPPTSAPPSLQNIYKLLEKEYPSTFSRPPRGGGLLTPWADRGVLLLNTCLTVRAHEANSHANHGWERFTQRVIDIVARQRTKGVVFLAWGTPAAKRVSKVDRVRHCVLQSVHPSPLSAQRGFVCLLLPTNSFHTFHF